jgi:DNA-binding transcriptional regulator YhcF (GntR family)
MASPIQKTSVSQQVVDYVLGCIDRGELKQGDCLPGEREFAESLGISRVPLREGISALAAMGIVEKRHGEGNFIAEFSSDVLGRILHTYTMLDHTLANLQALRYLAQRGCRGYLIGEKQIATAFADTLEFPGEAAGVISLLTMGESACVTIHGLQYELEKGMLTPDFPLGVSNHFVGKSACVQVHSGIVTALWDRENGLAGKGERK